MMETEYINKFCDNPKCIRHIPLDNKPYGIFVEQKNQAKKIDRYMYKKNDGTSVLYLCETCHTAVRLITSEA